MTTRTARTSLALGLAAALSATAAPLVAHAEPDATSTSQSVICEDIGEVRAQRAGANWQLLDQPTLSVAATGLACRATTADAEGHLASTGDALFHVTVDADEVLSAADAKIAERSAAGTGSVRAAAAADPAGYGPVTSFRFQSQLANYLNTRSGNVAVAWRQTGSNTIYSYYKGRATNVTASIVKLQIMATVMYQAQQQGRGLTEWEKSQMIPMIRVSDNDAATNLWKHVGGAPAVQAVNNRMGLRDTVNNTAWGLTVTSAPDQVVLMDHFAKKNPILSDGMRSYGNSLLRGASGWGVNQGPGTDIAVKNGWLPRTDGWHVNSVGYNHHTPGAYTAAVLTHSASGSLEVQKETIAGASRILYAHRNDPLANPPKPTAVRGDFTGDGRADLMGIKGSSLMLFKGLGNGKLAAPVKVGSGWNGATWIGSPGDVDRDGRSDLIVRLSNGSLWLYRGIGGGKVTQSRQVGHGWGGMSLISSVGDFDGDGEIDLLARSSKNALLQYGVPKSGYFYTKRQVGANWQMMTKILGSSFTADKKADVLAIRTTGEMYAYVSMGSRLASGRQVGHGWPSATNALVTVPGDLTGDGRDDVVFQTSTGLRTYPVRAGGSFGTSVASGATATGFTRLA